MKIGEIISGFRLETADNLPEFRAEGRFFKHEKTGCELYHFYNDDPENLFSFIFRTIPSDNTGVAHILEHTVLSGSEKFPLKDPFVQLLKSSMYTFLNAMTYPDKTVYPASSIVEADYFNLMSVYGNAVFFPLLKEEAFLQEGVRIQKTEDGGTTTYNYGGVVYNEMKGNYSDHNSVLAEWSSRSLFPDTSYRFDSGGEPEEICNLTYEDFKAFHKKYYHPSNCRIFLYGNIDTEKQLAFIENNFLSDFKRGAKLDPVKMQKNLSTPIHMEKYSHSDEGKGTTSITVNWLLGDGTDPLNALQQNILSELLIGSSGSPLYLDLINSKLGEDLSPVSGSDTGMRQIMFSVGMRGIAAEKKDEFVNLLFSSLKKITEEGFDSSLVEGTLRLFEFSNREIKGGRPSGLKFMGMCLRGWLHDNHPSETLMFAPLIKKIREEVGKDEKYFEKLLSKNLMANNHYSVIVVKPDNSCEIEENNKIDIDPSLAEEITAKKIMFEKYQAEKDLPEEIAKIPVLSLRNMPEKVNTIDYSVKDGLLLHECYTAGISYTTICYDISGLDNDLKILLPLFSRFIGETGLPGVPYYEVAKMANLKTGGFYMSPEAGADSNGRYVEFFEVYFKSLASGYGEATEFVFNLLKNGDLDDLARLKDVFMENLNDLKAAAVSHGNYTAALYGSKGYALSMLRQEEWSGISQLFYLQSIDSGDKKNLEEISIKLKKIRNYILNTCKVVAALTTEKNDIENHFKILSSSLFLPGRKYETASDNSLKCFLSFTDNFTSTKKATTEGKTAVDFIIAPSLVSYNFAAAPSAQIGSSEYVYEKIVARMLETGFLWDKVRMDGGAYGVKASVNGSERIFSFSSYRDPCIEETQKIFTESLSFLSNLCSKEGVESCSALEKAIISSIGKEIRPIAPGSRGMLALKRAIYGITDELRQQNRNIILSTSVRDIEEAALRLSTSFENDSTRCVVAGRDFLNKYKQFFDTNGGQKIELKL